MLKASGCEAMEFRVDTGSQWMLDEYYRRGFTVTRAEQVLAACRNAGIYSIARMTYPSPWDDFHTRAETVRLAERAKPHAVRVEMPAVAPKADGYGSSNTPGLEADTGRYLKHAATARGFVQPAAFPWRLHRGRGGTRSLAQAFQANQALRWELQSLGIATSVTPELALMAQVAGYTGRAQDFAMLMHAALATGDVEGLAAWVERFNAEASAWLRVTAPGANAFRLAAVGN